MIYQGVHFSSGVEDPDKLKYPIFTKIRNNIFTNCHEAIYTPPDSYPPAEISYNNFFQNTINNHLGNNFIKVDPRYIDAGKGDFNLNWGSGCIDSGDPIISNDPDGTRADIGSLYYDQTPVAPSSLDINSVNHHPHLTWPAEVPHHAGYNIYATYELYEGGVRNEVYHTANTSYTDESVDIVNPLIANQTVTYEVTSLNSIAAESDPSPSVSREVDGGVWKQANEEEDIPLVYKLKQNYPNPFNPSTTIKYELPDEGHVVIKLYDVLGREIQTLVNESKSPGRYEIKFDGSKLSSGVYIYRIEAGQFTSIKKLMLMK
ncbi:MAG: T9SS type A sorting domain-containing protein [Melioribacteraceae bacterium]|nr:T9SS type A sorting domain-containing protein [Melioribacteraceae bacterium]MCF8356756.1 T9SS type A sorting domain-containing protein [Melioribacteraceae bacterium]MCF8396139.1 T9SS type A sorting domain-containing protein [Melioribacteraceae bacterium]MCF8421116.1 T9SS type A sorting domain-containing protein [Melioribacteraceae bacterium]